MQHKNHEIEKGTRVYCVTDQSVVIETWTSKKKLTTKDITSCIPKARQVIKVYENMEEADEAAREQQLIKTIAAYDYVFVQESPIILTGTALDKIGSNKNTWFSNVSLEEISLPSNLSNLTVPKPVGFYSPQECKLSFFLCMKRFEKEVLLKTIPKPLKLIITKDLKLAKDSELETTKNKPTCSIF